MLKTSMMIVLTGMFCLGGCRVLKQHDTHQFLPAHITRYDTEVYSWLYADLRGDENDFMISSDMNPPGYYAIYVSDLKGKVISQLNSRVKMRSLRVLKDYGDNGSWLFYSYNDQKTVYLDAVKYDWQIPLQKETKRFETIQRTDTQIDNPKIEYYGQLYPEVLADIDSDGRYELVCRMLDGFTANPRGLVVYDFASGKIKWKYDTPCNINSVLVDDFDGDGSQELVLGTMAMKNTTQIINGLDDASGYIVVLSPRGKELYRQTLFSCYGQVFINAADVDQDGKKEIYSVTTTWGSEIVDNVVSMIRWTGSMLHVEQKLELSASLERNQYHHFLAQLDNSSRYHVLLVCRDQGLLVLDEELNQIAIPNNSEVRNIWDIRDLDGNGRKEILLQTDDYVFQILDRRFIRRASIRNPHPEVKNYSCGVVRTGLGKDSLIGIGFPHDAHYYSYKYLPVHQLLYRFYINHAGYLVVVLLIWVILLVLRNRQRQQIMLLTASHLGEGFLVLRDARKIIFANQLCYKLSEGSADPECRDLSLCCPKLYILLQKFIQSKLEMQTISSAIDTKTDRTYKVCILGAKGLGRRYLITFIEDHSNEQDVTEKLQWADIARRLSHHVRRHVTNILLALDVLQKDKDVIRSEYYQIIRDEIDKVRTFTHAFQRFTELKNYDLKLQDIIPSIEHCLARCKLSENVKLVKSWSLSSVHAYIEPIRFEEAIINTINNSLEAMPQGGTLHISVKELPLSSSPQGNLRVLVEIEDTGCGIPNKYMEDIWQPFFTTNQSGTGIGIPETRKIIDSMGGNMDIQSEEGICTIVSFWLKGRTDA